MRYIALACDYDGTLATRGEVDEPTLAALEEVLESGRKLILVTGRQLPDLLRISPRPDLFDRIVAENGALLYNPRTREEQLLAEPPSEKFLDALRQRTVEPLSVGKSIVATWQPHEQAVLDAIREAGLELQVTFNKGAVMVLPSGINKRSGLKAALRELGLSAHNTVGIGDAENDHAFLSLCECSAAVDNALDAIKERVDIVTKAGHGAGVVELVRQLLTSDLREQETRLRRRHILLGRDQGGNEVCVPPYGSCLLVAGPSGSGKSTVVTAILERLAKSEYQFCVVDPEGDYEALAHAVSLGDAKHAPVTEEVLQLLEKFDNPVVNLLGIPMADRPAFCTQILQKVVEFQTRTGRPHWVILDEAHHLLPVSWHPDPGILPQRFGSAILVTVHPEQVARAALSGVDVAIAVGKSPDKTLANFSKAVGQQAPPAPDAELENLEVVVWLRRQSVEPARVRIEPGEAERRRHRRKYAEGDVQEKSFYFRGPRGKLNLRAQNLSVFLQMAEGVDDETWLHHLQRGDYSQWVRSAIKDDALAEELARIEQERLSPKESRARIKAAIENLYTGPA